MLKPKIKKINLTWFYRILKKLNQLTSTFDLQFKLFLSAYLNTI